MTSSPLILGPMLRYVDDVSAGIWVETDRAARVGIEVGDHLFSASTFSVHGHHYALVQIDGLAPGTVNPYTVQIDDDRVWPESDSSWPAPVIATLDPERPVRFLFGSCRTSVPHDAVGDRLHGVDALRAVALQLAGNPGLARPDLTLFLGDQVYADVTSAQMREFIDKRRDIRKPPGRELADFEEYAHLYLLAWSTDAYRWLFGSVPTAMIFDDHDVRDDWNASLSWVRKMRRKPWWHGRIVAALASYWVYQHLGNLSPRERADDEIWRLVEAHEASDAPGELDLTTVIDDFAARCDREPKAYRWSFSRDFRELRLVILDSRAARVLDPANRALVDREEMQWLDDRLRGDVRHLVIGTSLPFLLPTGLHHLESWNEAISEGAWGRRMAAVGEWLRQALDLEHWAAFQRSFRQLASMVGEVADGRRGTPPDTVLFISGDVHYSYVAEARRRLGSRVVQAVCSPIRNPLPVLMRSFSAVLSYGIANRLSARLARAAGVAAPPLSWDGIDGPIFENCIATLADGADGLTLSWATGVVDGGDHEHPSVDEVSTITLSARR